MQKLFFFFDVQFHLSLRRRFLEMTDALMGPGL